MSAYNADNVTLRKHVRADTAQTRRDRPPQDDGSPSTDGNIYEDEPIEDEDVFESVWLGFPTVRQVRRENIAQRARQIIDQYVSNSSDQDRSIAEYQSLLQRTAVRLTKKYLEKRAARGSHTASRISENASDEAYEKEPTREERTVHPLDDKESSRGHQEERVLTENTTSPPLTVHPYARPYSKEFADRVSLQRLRDADIAQGRTPTIPDQGIVFEGTYPIEVRPPDTGVKKEENEDQVTQDLIIRGSMQGITPLSLPYFVSGSAKKADPLLGDIQGGTYPPLVRDKMERTAHRADPRDDDDDLGDMRHPIDRELEYTYGRPQPSAMNTHTPLRGATEAPQN